MPYNMESEQNPSIMFRLHLYRGISPQTTPFIPPFPAGTKAGGGGAPGLTAEIGRTLEVPFGLLVPPAL